MYVVRFCYVFICFCYYGFVKIASLKTSSRICRQSSLQRHLSTLFALRKVAQKQIGKDAVTNNYKINQKIIELLSTSTSAKMIDELRLYILSNEGNLNAINVLTIIQKASKQRLNPYKIVDIATVEKVLDPSSEVLNSRGLSSILYSLQSIPTTSIEFRRLISLASSHLQLNYDPFPLQAISFSLYGFQHCKGSEEEMIRPIIDSMERKLADFINAASPSEIESQAVGMICYGIRGLSVSSSTIQQYYSHINKLIEKTSNMLDSQAISNIIFGLRAFTSNKDMITDKVVASICVHLERYNSLPIDSANVKELAMLICGLQGLSTSDSTLRLVSILSAAIDRKIVEYQDDESKNPWLIQSPADLSLILAGFKSLDGRVDINQSFLRNIHRLINKDVLVWKAAPWTEQSIVNGLYGLQSLSSSHEETLELVAQLANIIPAANISLSNRGIAAALYGFQSMTAESVYVQTMLRYLVTNLNRNNQKASFGASFTAQDAVYACHGLQSMSTSDGAVVTALLNALAYTIENSKQLSLTSRQFAMAIYGLKSMSSDSKAVIRLVCALYNVWEENFTQSLTIRDVVNIMQGIRGMGSEHIIILNILSRLTIYLSETEESISGSNFAIICNSFQSMGGTPSKLPDTSMHHSISSILGFGIATKPRKRRHLPRQLIEILDVVYQKLVDREEKLSISMISSSLYGFQGFTCDESIIENFLSIFTADLQVTNEFMSSQSIGNSFYGESYHILHA
jgi:hypothetical protein